MSSAKDLYHTLSNSSSGFFECQLPVINETGKAICFDNYTGHLNHQKPVWIPKSQMEIVDGTGEGFGIRYFIKNWLYSKLK
jgi:hypothetical protein